jgi:Protein of unknown function (DUF938)
MRSTDLVPLIATSSILFVLVSGGGGARHLNTRVLPIPTTRRRRTAGTAVAFLAGRTDNSSGGSSSISRTTSWQQQQHRPVRSSSSMAKLESSSAERNKDPIWKVLETKVFPRLLPVLKKDNDSEQEHPRQEPLKVLEIAAGAGVHMQYFAQQLLNKNNDRPQQQQQQQQQQEFGAFHWQSTDPDPQCLDSLVARRNELLQSSSSSSPDTSGGAVVDATSCCAVQEPLPLTLDNNGICESSTTKKLHQYYDLIVNINMIHISPWEATLGLFQLAGERLAQPQQKQRRHGGILFLYGPYKVNGTCVESNRYVYTVHEKY